MAQIPQHRLSLLRILQVLQGNYNAWVPPFPTRLLSPAQSAGRFAGLLTVLAVVDLIDQKDIVKGFARCAKGRGRHSKRLGKFVESIEALNPVRGLSRGYMSPLLQVMCSITPLISG